MRKMRKTTSLILCALFAALIAIGAFLKIPLPHAPITMQTLFVLLCGMLLGGRRGAASCGVYLAVGLAGLPVFTKGGGLMYLFEPTFGYLAGFIFGALITGTLTENMHPLSFFKLFFAGAAGLLAIYASGVLYLFLVKNLYFGERTGVVLLAASGILPFLPADLLSCAICAWIAKKVRPLILSCYH